MWLSAPESLHSVSMADPFDDIPFGDEPGDPAATSGARSLRPGQKDSPRHEQAASGIAARAMAARRQAPPYLEGLNPEQRRAVETTDGPVLVLAGAGTGKTRVLTTRIAHILNLGLAWPSQILAVTFTNKAAREMKERIGILVGEAVEGMPWLGTFHSIGVKILRRHPELAGLRSDFTILDTDDQIRLLKQVIQAEGLDDKRWAPRTFAHMIDGWKNKGFGPKDIPEGDARAFANGKGRELFAAYQDRLKTLNAVDFGDLLCHPIRIFRDHPDVLAEYHRKFKYVLVDEYQDTNTAQYMWLRLIAQRPKSKNTGLAEASAPFDASGTPAPAAGGKPDRAPAGQAAPAEASSRSERSAVSVNLCCVGDDDQSIYGWRGAEVDNILRFEKDFPGAAVIRLERNYRSTEHILGAASHLIAHNEGRLGKTLFTEQSDPDNAKVQVHAAWDSEEEARAVGEEIEQKQRRGHALNDMADARARLLPDARVRGPLRHAWPQLPRHRRSALLRTHGDPRRDGLPARRRATRRRPRLRAHRQHAETRARRSLGAHDPRFRAQARRADAGGRRRTRPDRGDEAEAPRRAARTGREFHPLARSP
jgi:DNA helicase-2/ATP-dependent DNA helicase PcrA